MPWAITFDIRWRESVWGEQTQVKVLEIPHHRCLGGLNDSLIQCDCMANYDFKWTPLTLSYLQERMVKMFAAKELGLDTDMLSYRLRQLTLLLPDMSKSWNRMYL